MTEFKVSASYNNGTLKPPSTIMQEVNARTMKLADRIGNFKSPMARISVFLDRWVQTNFKTEGGKVGGWEPFAFGGRLTSNGIDTSARLLQDTGRLRASFTPYHKPKEAGIFSELPYSELHDEGIGVPQRRLLPKKIEVQKDIANILRNHAARAIKAK